MESAAAAVMANATAAHALDFDDVYLAPSPRCPGRAGGADPRHRRRPDRGAGGETLTDSMFDLRPDEVAVKLTLCCFAAARLVGIAFGTVTLDVTQGGQTTRFTRTAIPGSTADPAASEAVRTKARGCLDVFATNFATPYPMAEIIARMDVVAKFLYD